MTLILKVPFSKGGLGKTQGCEKAPDQIIQLFQELNLNESGLNPKVQISEIPINQFNIEETNNSIFENIDQELTKQNKLNTQSINQTKSNNKNKKIILIGGDHSITYSSFKAAAKHNPNLGLVLFDAHPDCENNFHPPTHEDFVKVLIREKILKPQNLIIIGLRSWDGKEKEFLDAEKIQYYTMKKLTIEGISNICDGITETLNNWDSVYLSIDIDVVDPAFAPGTGYCEPGGLTSRDLIYCLQRIKLLKNLKMIDLVEINPIKDITTKTVSLGAKILKELV
ncbi:arginase family protein [Candidatus Woesearchaeota archaeon]|jgi:arginase|nr:arginase family protein [Candidatus Woesearchaeota archaeon]